MMNTVLCFSGEVLYIMLSVRSRACWSETRGYFHHVKRQYRDPCQWLLSNDSAANSLTQNRATGLPTVRSTEYRERIQPAQTQKLPGPWARSARPHFPGVFGELQDWKYGLDTVPRTYVPGESRSVHPCPWHGPAGLKNECLVAILFLWFCLSVSVCLSVNLPVLLHRENGPKLSDTANIQSLDSTGLDGTD